MLQQDYWLYFFIVILFVNILEALLLAIRDKNSKNLRVNNILILAMLVFVPINWSTDYNLVGFSAPLWVAAYTLTLGYLYTFGYSFHHSKVCYINILILAIAWMAALIMQNPHYWMACRAYTLYFAIIQFSLFPHYSQYLYPEKLNYISVSKLQGTILDYTWLFINTCVILKLIVAHSGDFAFK
ncbi:hypothetical protein [uncultured Shewanella sp.]|uniref:hypothetical protein n=1 Tax=uncultured Shewanella sp. TaxID=173975 RepID=UPI0026366ED2|nr:hypothetical protein [uncultured Shewanella sp.]